MCCLASPSKKQQRTRKQETKKPKTKNNKKPTKTKNKKTTKTHKTTILHTPRGGVVAESWILFFFVCFFLILFLFFLVSCLFWFCPLQKNQAKPSRNCECLQSSERTIAHVQCQWLQNAVKNRNPRVSPSTQK